MRGAVLKYPDFRNSIKMIHEDSKILAEATALETIFITKTPSCDRIHTEARTGVVGRTAKLVTMLESLSDQAKGIKAPATKADVRGISELSRLLKYSPRPRASSSTLAHFSRQLSVS